MVLLNEFHVLSQVEINRVKSTSRSPILMYDLLYNELSYIYLMSPAKSVVRLDNYVLVVRRYFMGRTIWSKI